MATYNGERFLSEQIDSILKQLNQDDELIVSDDGSTDKTLDIIREYNDPRIKLLYNNQHNYTSNFENALKHAAGDFIFLSDQDDIWDDNKVAIALSYLKKYDFIMSNALIVDGNNHIISKSRNSQFLIGTGFLRNIIKTYYLGCCFSFNKKVLSAVLPFPPNRELCLHDAWITVVSELLFKTHVCNECLIRYRMHGSNASSGSVGITNSFYRMIIIRLYLFFSVLKRGIAYKLGNRI